MGSGNLSRWGGKRKRKIPDVLVGELRDKGGGGTLAGRPFDPLLLEDLPWRGIEKKIWRFHELSLTKSNRKGGKKC